MLLKSVVTLSICTAGVGTYLGTQGADAFAVEPEAVASPQPPIEAVEATAPTRFFGAVCSELPEPLRVQLDVPAGEGLLITEVAQDSSAADARLEVHDVVLRVNGAPVSEAALTRAVEAARGAALEVLRGGLPRLVRIQGDAPTSPFLSTASLQPDHPLRRAAQLDDLRSRYEQEADAARARLQELEGASRRVKQEARESLEELRRMADEQVSEYLEAQRVALHALADGGLDSARAARLGQLGVDLEVHVPAARWSALDDSLEGLEQELRQGVAERAALSGDERLVSRWRSRVGQVGEEAGQLLHARVRHPLGELVRELERHSGRLARQHAERTEWATETVSNIHEEVGERIDCAIDRAKNEYSKRIERRLRSLDLPAPGELEASLADLSAQLEAWTRGFVERTDAALTLYEDQLTCRAELLVPSLEAGLPAAEEAQLAFAEGLERTLAAQLDETHELTDDWRGTDAGRSLRDELRAELAREIAAGRDGLRAPLHDLDRALNEERVKTDQAFEDLQRLLKSVRSEARDDCWKLDGPHLDGRFPRRPPGSEDAGDEVAMLIR